MSHDDKLVQMRVEVAVLLALWYVVSGSHIPVTGVQTTFDVVVPGEERKCESEHCEYVRHTMSVEAVGAAY